MAAAVRELVAQVRLADLLDIAIVSALLYLAFAWLRDRASRTLRMVAIGLPLLFVAARRWDLYLTTLAFQYGSVVLLLALVVVFQNDIRHDLERLAVARLWGRSRQPRGAQVCVDILAAAVAQMAAERTGALIVFPGRQRLDQHLRGGVGVDAEISPNFC